MNDVFVAVIQSEDGTTRQHGFHLGTDEGVAKTLVYEIWRREVNRQAPVRAVLLMKGDKCHGSQSRCGWTKGEVV